MKRGRQSFAFLLLLSILAIALPALALQYPLSDTAIREAFLTGNADYERANEFLRQYAHNFPRPAVGPYIETISIQTPFEQVVERGATVTNYHAQEAEQEFLGKPLPFLVRLQVQFTATYPDSPPEGPDGAHSLLPPLPDYMHDFKIAVTQGTTLVPKATRAYLINSDASGAIWGDAGIVIEQEYDPEKIDSSELTVEVRAPGDQDVVTAFDLQQLQ